MHKQISKRSFQHIAEDSPYRSRYCEACDLWMQSRYLKRHVRTEAHVEWVAYRAWQRANLGRGNFADFRWELERLQHTSP